MKRRVPQHDRWTDGSLRDPSTLTREETADWIDDTHSAVYVAILRKDGFVSLNGNTTGGHLLTRPIKWTGNHLSLNLDAPTGSAQIEFLDEQGTPIPGLSGSDAPIVQGDGVCLSVSHDLSNLIGQIIQLKIHLKNARFYALWTA